MTLESIAENWSAERLETLRAELRRQKLDGFVIPRSDRHQGEYCAPHDERFAWATGFSGSWGMALVTRDRAILLVDGRYTVQAAEQVDEGAFTIRHLYDEPLDRWIAENGRAGEVYGYDRTIVTPQLHEALSQAALQTGVTLRPVERNPIDAVWADRPSRPAAPFEVHPLSINGEDARSKRARLAAALDKSGIDILVETQTDNVAWLLNIRGFDVPFVPVVLASMLVERSGRAHLFLEREKIFPGWLECEAFDVELHDPDAMFDVLRSLVLPGMRVSVDPRFAPVGAVEVTREAGGTAIVESDPLTRLKSVKNAVELGGLREASRRDSIAWCRFLAWLSPAVRQRDAAGKPIDEREAEARILDFRRELDEFIYPSFRTISAADANAAMCHYAAPSTGSAPLRRDSLYLIDSGGQYLDGTTDATRTVCFSSLDPEVRRNFTLVLKGHIRLATLVFPVGTKGHQIDAFAREALWRHRLDYDHGTGHGVGQYLSVHEQPQRLAKEPNMVPLQAGMTITNEPGYYTAGRYGIRIENLCEIVEIEPGWLSLSEMTLVPIQPDLIDATLLDAQELAWLDAYHARVRREIGPHLGPTERAWLAVQTRPLGRACDNDEGDPGLSRTGDRSRATAE